MVDDLAMPVPDSDFPQLFVAADHASTHGQKLYLRGTRLRLLLVVGAAGCGIGQWRVGSSHDDLLGLLAVVLFVLAVLLEGVLWKRRPERDWYDGRALAESVKTLAWKFAVCGDPFPISMPDQLAVGQFIELLNELRKPYQGLTLSPVPGEAVTGWMSQLRRSSISVRCRSYLEDRVEDQQRWYTVNATKNGRLAAMWRTILIGLELVGALTALLESLTRNDLRFTPVLAASVGAVVAWLETKQHEQMASAYSTAVADLGNVRSKLKMVSDEQAWAREMSDAEEAISREHTLWRASRSQL